MHLIPFATIGRKTSRLGFGCSGLMGAAGRKHSMRLLETAYDAGIRHFDVAPMYGYGEAERCLGDFLQNHGSDITVTTKFGLAAAKDDPFIRAIRRVASVALRLSPALKRRLAPASNALGGGGTKLRFEVVPARLSLENSLRNLRRTQLDLWLLHEAAASDLKDESLLRFLEDAQISGKIGAFGIGGEAANVTELLAQQAAYCQVLQYEWSVFDSDLPSSPGFRIYHRPLSARFRQLVETLDANRILRRDWSIRVGEDLQNETMLAALMLKASLEHHPASPILFSSRSPSRILANAATADDVSLAEPALCLRDLVRTQRAIYTDPIKTGK